MRIALTMSGANIVRRKSPSRRTGRRPRIWQSPRKSGSSLPVLDPGSSRHGREDAQGRRRGLRAGPLVPRIRISLPVRLRRAGIDRVVSCRSDSDWVFPTGSVCPVASSRPRQTRSWSSGHQYDPNGLGRARRWSAKTRGGLQSHGYHRRHQLVGRARSTAFGPLRWKRHVERPAASRRDRPANHGGAGQRGLQGHTAGIRWPSVRLCRRSFTMSARCNTGNASLSCSRASGIRPPGASNKPVQRAWLMARLSVDAIDAVFEQGGLHLVPKGLFDDGLVLARIALVLVDDFTR